MERSQKSLVGYAAILLGALVVVAVIVRLSQGEAAFCRSVFRHLINGSESAQQHIDWEHLNAVGVDVGKTYAQLPNEQAKAQYRKAFVSNCAMGFYRTGATLTAFRNWRVLGRDRDHVTVAADYQAKHKTLLFSLPAVGEKKIEAIQWQ